LLLYVLSLRPLGLARQKFVKLDLGAPDDLLVQRLDESVERTIRNWLEDPVAVFN
jgi:hypothetical protein